MADNNLNPGQRRYEHLVDNHGGLRDIEQEAASGWSTDYSQPTDHSAGINDKQDNPITDHNNIGGANDNFLANAENSALTDESPIRDLGASETQASYDVARFDQQPASGRQKVRMSGFKKKMIAAGVCLFATSGLFLGLFTAISGPLQLVQAAKLIQNFQLGVTAGQKAARSLSNSSSIARRALNGGDTIGGRVQNSRLGLLGNMQADKMTERMAKRGVEFNSNSFGGNGGMTINPSQALGITDLNSVDVDDLAEELGVPASKIDIDTDSNVIHLSSDLSYSEARRAISSLDDPAMTGVKSWLQTRSTLKRAGYTSWLHPFEKAKSAAYTKLTDFIEEQVGKIIDYDAAGQDASNRIKKGLGEDTDPDPDNHSHTSADEVIQETTEKMESSFKKKSRAILNQASKLIDGAQKFLSLKSVNIIQMVLGFICMMRSIQEEAGPYKQTNVVNVAEKGASQIMGYGSQVQSGEDIDLDSAKMAVKMTMGDDVEILDDAGQSKDPPEYVFSSFWDAAPICTTLGTSGCNSAREDNVPESLGTVSSALNFFGDPTLDGIINAALSSPIAAVGCWAFTLIDGLDVIGNAIGTVIGNAINSLLELTGLDAIFANFMGSIGSYFLGAPLDLATITPEQWGSVGMYGGKFTSNDQARSSGGKRLTSQAAIELNLENRRYLAWENSRKPIMARLFDPADYNSSINQIARSIHIDSSDQSLSTQLANVAKMFASAPTILATASNQILGGSAYAASTYDYGVSTYNWELSEMNEITNGAANSQYDLYTNTENALDMLQAEDDFEEENARKCAAGEPDCIDLSEGPTYKEENPNRWLYLPKHTYAKWCMASDIQNEDGDYAIEAVDNQDGESWNYVDDNGPNGLCASYQDADGMKSIRLYVMDYYNVVSGACYYGEEGDSDSDSACNEMSVNSAGGSSSSSGGGVTSGNEDAEVWQDRFANETHGTYGSYRVGYNGCTTVSAWFVGAHTTLTYAHGNGKDVVANLVAANPQLTMTSNSLGDNCKLPALFSTTSSAMNASGATYGHVGLVTAVDPDGTLHTLETGSRYASSPKYSFTDTHPPSDYSSNTQFVCLGDYLK